MNKSPSRYKEGSIERRGAVWFFRYRDGNCRKRIRIGSVKDFPTKGAAERACTGVRQRINSPEAAIPRRTMNDVVARYLMEEMPASPSTIKNYRHYLRCHIVPKWGDYALADIRAHEVRAWIRAIALGDKSRGHIHGLMRVLFRFAMLWEWYPATINPMQLFKLENTSKRAKEPRILTPQEFSRLLTKLSEPYRSMAVVCAALGLRCSELVGLQWGDIDWHRKTLKISRAVVGKNIGDVKTKQSGKPIQIADEMMKVFASLRSGAQCANPDEWVFPSSRAAGRKPWNAYALQRYQITPAAVAAGLGDGIGWHTLRHSYRSWLDRIGASVGVQRDLMRHTDIRTTMNTYGGAFVDSMREAQGSVAKMVLQ